ncbi:Crp/Fnr family transcriptional regulator [Catenulispora pinisilvae]|uniref:Crp/Fnr family transcriptional regulator n=1 Tax=Catenulispora pinisilvae TaxID=2705253 RepID=UPI0018918879|nr:Crp/Fnr family transcriptional regulator [Catenulispora pinisilvae]
MGGVPNGRWPHTSLVGRLGPDDRAVVLGLGGRVRHRAGEALIREGEDSDFVLILLGGMVKVSARAQDGREALLAVRIAGDLIGEFAGIDGRPRSARITACGSLLAQRVGRAPFLACLQANPGIAIAVNEVVVAKMRAATGRIVDFAGCDVLTRLARMLRYLVLTYPRPGGPPAVINPPLSQAELATLVGASDSAVGKSLRTLREREIISTRYRAVTIRDLTALAEIASEAA